MLRAISLVGLLISGKPLLSFKGHPNWSPFNSDKGRAPIVYGAWELKSHIVHIDHAKLWIFGKVNYEQHKK